MCVVAAFVFHNKLFTNLCDIAVSPRPRRNCLEYITANELQYTSLPTQPESLAEHGCYCQNSNYTTEPRWKNW